MVEVEKLYKSYGATKALNGVTFSVDRGEIWGVIGPDGAGKSSLFRILASLLLPDSGTVTIDNIDVLREYKKIRRIVGYMPGTFSLYQDMTVEENLTFFATIFGTTIEENYHLVKDIYSQIEPFKNRRAGALSGGMKQKLALSCALIHKPKLLILDEPTTGVDPVSRKELWDMLFRLKEDNITILVSTAYMDEASLCDRIALIKDGKFMANDTPRSIIDNYGETLWAVEGSKMPALLRVLRKKSEVKTVFAFGDKLHITVEKGLEPKSLQLFLESRGYGDVEIYPIQPTIEDCFMDLAN